MICKSWRANRDNFNEFSPYPDEIRRATYATCEIESLNCTPRNVTTNRSAFPTDRPAKKLLHVALSHALKKDEPIRNQGAAQNQCAVYFRERVTW